MKIVRIFAESIGWFVCALSLLGLFGAGDFRMTFGPSATSPKKTFECISGDTFLTRKKFACSEQEFRAQQ